MRDTLVLVPVLGLGLVLVLVLMGVTEDLVHLTEHRDGLVEVGVEVTAEQVEHFEEHGIAQRVVDLVADLAVDDNMLRAQDRRC